MTLPEKIVEIIKNESNFLILTHSTPDGDAFGSAISLKIFLETLGKEATVYTEHPIPSQYQFLPGIDKVKDIKNLSTDAFNVIVLVDCNNPSRVSYDKEIVEIVKKFEGKKIIIDHHIEDGKSVEFTPYRWIEPDVAATGLMIHKLIKTMNGKINHQIATNLYTAIIVDTGNFQFDNTTEEVFLVASELVRAGAKPSFIYQNAFESWSENRFRLFQKMLNSVEIISSVAIACINKKLFDETATTEPDTERFVEFLRILKNVTVSALLREVEQGFIKVSLRSKGDCDVSKIAREFGGGGHKNAAGYRTSLNMEEAKQKLIEKLKEFLIL